MAILDDSSVDGFLHRRAPFVLKPVIDQAVERIADIKADLAAVPHADPARDLAVSLMTSGKPAMSPGILRTFWIMQMIAKRIPRDGHGPLMQRS